MTSASTDNNDRQHAAVLAISYCLSRGRHPNRAIKTNRSLAKTALKSIDSADIGLRIAAHHHTVDPLP